MSSTIRLFISALCGETRAEAFLDAAMLLDLRALFLAVFAEEVTRMGLGETDMPRSSFRFAACSAKNSLKIFWCLRAASLRSFF